MSASLWLIDLPYCLKKLGISTTQCAEDDIIIITGFANQILFIFSGALLGGSLLEWIYFVSKYTVNPFIFTDCKLPYFCWYFFKQYSSILLVMMSVEKCIVVYFPLIVRNICTVKTAKWACLVAAIIFFAFHCQWFFIIENRSKYCYYVEDSQWYIIIFNRIDSIIYSFGPFGIMGLTNIAIIYKFINAKLAVKHGTESTNQALSKSAMRGTAILITVSLTFIILTGPAPIYYSFFEDSTDPIVYVTVNMPTTLNHGVNSVMYCIVGSKFRRDLVDLMCCGRKKVSSKRGKSNMGSTQMTVVLTLSTN